jgi:putative tryptophan/tyrosine transport system substrate-binding protein
MSKRFGCLVLAFIFAGLLVSGALAVEQPRIGVLISDPRPHFQVDQKGFEMAMEQAGFEPKYTYKNAQGEASEAEAIAQQFVDEKFDLVHAIGTVAAQSAVKVIKSIPVVYSSVPDPVAEGIVPSMDAAGGNVTGVIDAWPFDDQINLYHRILPEAKRWGTIYNVEDQISVQAIDKARATMQQLGLELVEATFSGAEDAEAKVNEAAQSLVGKVDAIYIARDRTVASAFGRLARITNSQKIPLFTGYTFQVPLGAIAALGIDYVQVGITAGHRAGKILKEGISAGEIPSGEVEHYTLFISRRAAKNDGVTVPEEILQQADRVF